MIEYDEKRTEYDRMGEIVYEKLKDALHDEHIHPMQVTYRIKTRSSVENKLIRKPEKYQKLTNMTDIAGFRVICYFSDQVDQVARLLEENFVVDKVNSVDKRNALPTTSFGYSSLHYICTLPHNGEYPEKLCVLPFEVQIRSVLQHAWAEIEHDLGYKSAFGVPRDIRREFSRLAGLLEIADDLFVGIKNELVVYKDQVRKRIAEDKADDLTIDRHTLSAYIKESRTMQSFIMEIADICGAEIQYIDPEPYIPKLDYLDIHTLGELKELVYTEHDGALNLAMDALTDSEIDTLTSVVGLYYLCRSKLIYGDYSRERIANFFHISISSEERVMRRTNKLLEKRESVRARAEKAAEDMKDTGT